MTQRHWLELTLIADNDDDVLLLETALECAGAVAVTYQAANEEEIFEPEIGTTPMWSKTGVTGLFPLDTDPNAVIELLMQALGEDYPIAQYLLPESDWTRAWLEHFQPIAFGNHFWVAASEHVIEEHDAKVLRLDPGLAFGTGTHPSTAMCLHYLVNHAALHGKTVYDYGCGSGILGIAAAMMGAKAVYQTDIDPQALTASYENAQKNQVAEKIFLCEQPDLAPAVDLLVANILLEPLCALRVQFEKHLHAQSVMIFSGLLERQQQKLEQAYQDRYRIERINCRAGWILLRLTSL